MEAHPSRPSPCCPQQKSPSDLENRSAWNRNGFPNSFPRGVNHQGCGCHGEPAIEIQLGHANSMWKIWRSSGTKMKEVSEESHVERWQ